MKVLVIGAGLVGTAVVEALHADHELTVVDLDGSRLRAIAQRFDVATAQASGASPTDLVDAGLARADLLIACTSEDEVNLVAGTFARSLAPRTTTIVRTSRAEYAEVWRTGRLDVDHVVSTELETARAVSASIGLPTARHTDTFADGQVQIVELEIEDAAAREAVGLPLREARLPGDSRLAGVIRDGKAIFPDGDAVLRPGDRAVVVGSPGAARRWADLLSPSRGEVREVIVFGAGGLGLAIVRILLGQRIGVRVVEADPELAAAAAERLPEARVFNTDGLDPAFLRREGIARVQAAIFAMRDDARNLFAATLTRALGVPYTIALAHDRVSGEVYDFGAVDVTVDPRLITAEEIVRFAHDPRTHQVAMLEGDRFVILDITTRPGSEYVGLSLRDMPIRGAVIGAIVRDGRALFPRSDDVLQAGDRVIVFTEASRAHHVERVL
jgi:trk system potassium uptake protein TrkA